MTTETFNQIVETNGGIENLILVRATGIGEIILVGSYARGQTPPALNQKTSFEIKNDMLNIYQYVATPQGPQVRSVRVIPLKIIYELTFFYQASIHDNDISPPIDMNNFVAPVVVPPLPDPADIPRQIACISGFMNAVNSGAYDVAITYLNPDAPTYSMVTPEYLRDVVFPGSPAIQLSDEKIYDTFATIVFGSEIYLFGIIIKGAKSYISSIGGA